MLAFHLTDTTFSKNKVLISSKKCETHVFVPKLGSHVSSVENESRIFNSKHEPRVFETYILEFWYKTRIHSLTFKTRAELGSPHPQSLEADLFDPPQRI